MSRTKTERDEGWGPCPKCDGQVHAWGDDKYTLDECDTCERAYVWSCTLKCYTIIRPGHPDQPIAFCSCGALVETDKYTKMEKGRPVCNDCRYYACGGCERPWGCICYAR